MTPALNASARATDRHGPHNNRMRGGAKSRWVIFASLVCLLFLGWRLLFRAPRPPFELSFWYWHNPFTLTGEQILDLKKLGVRKLFVHAGTFSSDGKNMVLVIPQKYGPGTGDFQIHAVFNFDSGVVRHFESYDLTRMAGQIATRVDAQVRHAQQAGLQVVGVQFDFDCPTRLLPRYAELIEQIRPQLKSLEKPVVSATGLMSWLGTSGVRALSRQVDFLVPQAYEGITGRTIDTMRPVSDEPDFRKRIRRADDLDCPFYVGIPAYGHGFLFDPQGKLLDIFRQLEPDEMIHSARFNFIDAYISDRNGKPAKQPSDSVGEEILKFRAVEPGLNGEGMGDEIGFTTPTPELLIKMLRAARETQSPSCLGGIIYRMPEGDSESTLPWRPLMAALSGSSAEPKLKIKFETVADSFDVIESVKPLQDAPKDLDLEIENVGGATLIDQNAVELQIRLQRPGVDDIRSRDMELVSAGVLDDRGIQRCSDRDVNALQFTRAHLDQNEKVFVGPIRLLSSKRQRIVVEWTAKSQDGFKTEKGSVEIIQ